MPLEIIIESIEAEARQQAEEILSRAREQAKTLLEETKKQATRRGEAYYNQVIKDCRKKADQRVAAAQLQARTQILQLRQQYIDQAFTAARQKLASLETDVYRKWVKANILKTCETAEAEIILSVKDKERLGRKWEEEVRQALRKKGVGEKIQFNYEQTDFTGGFILRTPHYEVAATFEEQLKSVRDRLQFKINRILFGENGGNKSPT